MKKTDELGLALHRGGHSLSLDVHEISSIAAPINTIVKVRKVFCY
jgi:hypothetical protein